MIMIKHIFFWKILLDQEVCVSSISFMSFYNDFEQLL